MSETQAIIRQDTPTSIASRKFHTDPDCPDAKKIKWPETVLVSALPDEYTECLKCSGNRLPYGFETDPRDCQTCGAGLVDGECRFCAWYERIHSVPRDARFCRIEDKEVIAGP